jgi:hypothetical protein
MRLSHMHCQLVSMRYTHNRSTPLNECSMFVLIAMSLGSESRMFVSVSAYRAVVFDRAIGPWRLRLSVARQDAISEGMGVYDEQGLYFDIVPGSIETKLVNPQILGMTDDQVAELLTFEKRAILSVQRLQRARHQEGFRDAPGWRSRGSGARGRL